jgi:two-component system chemotaxis sensor kinase CheA
MSFDISQFLEVFFEEAEELLTEKERLLLAIDISAPDTEDLNAIFRTAHSIKSGASALGLDDMAEVTHTLESLLDQIRRGEMAITAEHVDFFLAAKDILIMQLNGHRSGAYVDFEAVGDVHMMLQALSQVSTPPKSITKPLIPKDKQEAIQNDGPRRFKIEMPTLAQRDIDAVVDELGLLGEITVASLAGNRHTLTLTTHEHLDEILSICAFVLDPATLKIFEAQPLSPTQKSAYDDILDSRSDRSINLDIFVDDSLEINGDNYGLFQPIVSVSSESSSSIPSASIADKKITPKKEDKAITLGSDASSIRVSVEKVDQLINLIGELVITQAMIEQRSEGLDASANANLLSSVAQLTRNTRALQEAVMSIRMMPIDFVFSRFPRMVRDLSAKLGKRVDVITRGAATELDKGLIERIVDPLTHLVRNSIDHGIEMPDARLSLGKTATGMLFLSARHQEGNLIIEVADDGSGLDRDRILAKAAQNGLLVGDKMSDAEVWQLIFEPGFSTAEIVTDVSGRGVGMDVVKRNITAMGGTVGIKSTKGSGTTISISLPITLAILDGMSIRCGDEVYIVPLNFVVESIQPDMLDIKDIASSGRVIKVRGEFLPLIALHQIFEITPRAKKPSEGVVVILEVDGSRVGMFVDELVGQQQVVVKSIESNYRRVNGISGATILGDGSVAMILDVYALMKSTHLIEDNSTRS